MALTVEDGSVVAGANTYADLSTVRAYATARGVSLSGDDVADEILVIKAMDYLESADRTSRFQGERVSELQTLAFPRYPVYCDGFLIGSDEIPPYLVYALCALVIELQGGKDLLPTRDQTTKGSVVKEKVGSIEVTYDSPATQFFTPAFAKADALLAHLYKRGGLSLVRT